MLTSFGKLVRKLRVERSMKLKDLAERLKVSDSYLSAAEFGKRAVPDEWFDVLVEEFSLDVGAADELKRSIQDSKRSVKLNVAGHSDRLRREVAFAFARFIEDADTNALQEVKRLIEGVNNVDRERERGSAAVTKADP